MRVLITGSTGMVGKGVLLECLDHPDVQEIICINRSPLNLNHPKLTEIIHQDFSDFSSILPQIPPLHGAFLCMGVSSAGKSEEEFYRLTYDYTLSLAKPLAEKYPEMVLTYVSGQGTDSTEKGRTMWARVKGKTENALLNLPNQNAYMFRPGIIIPLRGIRSSTKLYQFFYDYFMWLIKIVKWLRPSSVVNTTEMGQAMINIVHHGYSKNHLEPADIKRV